MHASQAKDYIGHSLCIYGPASMGRVERTSCSPGSASRRRQSHPWAIANSVAIAAGPGTVGPGRDGTPG